MRSIAIIFSMALLPLALLAGVVDTDWCRIETPEVVQAKGKFTVKFQLKAGAPANLKVGGDLHLLKQNGHYIGFGAWGGEAKAVAPGTVTEFSYTVPAMRSGSDAVLVHYYLSSSGWGERVKDAPSARIKVEGANTGRPASATLKKSWITTGKIRRDDGKSLDAYPLRDGETLILPVQYYVDPADDWGGTELTVMGLGPWIDCPDGVYTKHQRHMMYPLHIPPQRCVIGQVVKKDIAITVPQLFSNQPPEKGVFGDSLLFLLQFRGNDGEKWPWHVRADINKFRRKDGYFHLSTTMPGNLFPYSRQVEVQITPGTLATAAAKDGEKTLAWQLFDITGALVDYGQIPFAAAKGMVAIHPNIPAASRGTFRFRAQVDGWECQETTLARIPDLEINLTGESTIFGGQKFAEDPEAVAAARLIGLSYCRTWVKWSNLQPAATIWNQDYLQELENTVATLNANGIRPWLVLYEPPAWVIDNPNGWSAGFFPFPFQDQHVAAVAKLLALRFKGKVIGFEWLNEICPGKLSTNPVEDYVRLCKVATAAVKAVDPSFEIQAAGGLWPHSYRKSLLAGGLAAHIDLLPVHYGAANTVQMAQEDLKLQGSTIPVIDNETARGVATWGMPLEVALKDKIQSDYFYQRFPAEIMAGCRRIVLFGGEADPAGNWSLFWGDMSPRPSAAALAVLISKLHNAKPIGEFSLGRGDSIKLFQSAQGKPVMIVSTLEQGGESIDLPAGNLPLTITDQQGNEKVLGVSTTHRLALTDSPYIVEGGEMDVLKAQLMAQIIAGASGGVPRKSLVKGNQAELAIAVSNLTDQPMDCQIQLHNIPGSAEPIAINGLKPGQNLRRSFVFRPESSGNYDSYLEIKYSNPRLPVVKKRILINVIQPDAVGNLLKNPGFELQRTGQDSAGVAADWHPTPATAGQRFLAPEGNDLGHGQWVFRFQGVEGQYISMFQNVKTPIPAGKYLYSFWIKSDKLQTGSNYGAEAPNGKSINRHWLQVFQSPVTQPHWDVFSTVLEVPEGATRVSCSPVCFGTGWSMIDNAIFTLYEGTEHVAFAPKKGGAITIDGDLSDFDRSSPVPLLGKSQLRPESADYQWHPDNFSGVAYFNWDEQYLYVAVEVVDREHTLGGMEGDCVLGDSVEIAIHPQNRLPGEDSKAFLFQISGKAPGGSGKHTIYRPDQYCGGLKAGSLAKDSSIYDLAVKRQGNRTYYEIAMPWQDLGGVQGEFATKIGLSIALNDGDGKARKASMLWGGGIRPAWSPTAFGMLLLTAPQESPAQSK